MKKGQESPLSYRKNTLQTFEAESIDDILSAIFSPYFKD